MTTNSTLDVSHETLRALSNVGMEHELLEDRIATFLFCAQGDEEREALDLLNESETEIRRLHGLLNAQHDAADEALGSAAELGMECRVPGCEMPRRMGQLRCGIHSNPRDAMLDPSGPRFVTCGQRMGACKPSSIDDGQRSWYIEHKLAELEQSRAPRELDVDWDPEGE